MKIRSLRNLFRLELAEIYSEREADQIFLRCLSHYDRKGRMDVVLNDLDLNAANYQKAIEQLKTFKPIQYILQSAPFYHADFKVNESVLIPRPETEELVSWVLNEEESGNLDLIDVGAGSGCIAISLKRERPQWNITALEVSPEAVELIKWNSAQLKAEVPILLRDVLKMDELDADVVVSNPPYIPHEDKLEMSRQVLDYEPELALFVDGDPLIFYKHIINICKLNTQIYFEIHEDYKSELENWLKEMKLDFEFRKDLQGKFRMLKVKK